MPSFQDKLSATISQFSTAISNEYAVFGDESADNFVTTRKELTAFLRARNLHAYGARSAYRYIVHCFNIEFRAHQSTITELWKAVFNSGFQLELHPREHKNAYDNIPYAPYKGIIVGVLFNFLIEDIAKSFTPAEQKELFNGNSLKTFKELLANNTKNFNTNKKYFKNVPHYMMYCAPAILVLSKYLDFARNKQMEMSQIKVSFFELNSVESLGLDDNNPLLVLMNNLMENASNLLFCALPDQHPAVGVVDQNFNIQGPYMLSAPGAFHSVGSIMAGLKVRAFNSIKASLLHPVFGKIFALGLRECFILNGPFEPTNAGDWTYNPSARHEQPVILNLAKNSSVDRYHYGVSSEALYIMGLAFFVIAALTMIALSIYATKNELQEPPAILKAAYGTHPKCMRCEPGDLVEAPLPKTVVVQKVADNPLPSPPETPEFQPAL